MARWTGHPNITAVLEAADAWKKTCFLDDGSLLSEERLWTGENLSDLLARYASNPILGSSRDFTDKLKEQLQDAPGPICKLAAETLWLLLLFPYRTAMRPETKRSQIENVWSWSGEPLPSSPYLDDEHLDGVGHPGTAYMTHRPAEFEFLLRTIVAYKALPSAGRTSLLENDPPWDFMRWLDNQEGADRRLFRNALLYFIFPDSVERNLSREHRQQIYEALKGKLPTEQRIRSRTRSLLDYDRAIYHLRQAIAAEKGTNDFDFYQEELKSQWFSPYRESRRKDFSSWLDTFLSDRGLRLNQSGRDTTIEKLRTNGAIAPETGFWSDESGFTAKPPRWLLHFDLTQSAFTVLQPPQHRSGVVGFANTKGGDSGALAVRILAVAKTDEQSFQPIEQWEWLLLFCFPGGLKPGSAAQAFDNFDPSTGILTYMGAAVPYIFAGLLALNGPDEVFSTSVGGVVREITYRDATEAIQSFINIAALGGANE